MSEDTEAEIVLAECSGRAWLVRGEPHMDKLLANTLEPNVSIEVIACESKSAVDALWRRWNEEDLSYMWLVHPAIVDRVRGKPANSAVAFPAWSAALDDAGLRVIAATAESARERPEVTVALVRNRAEGSDRGSDDLAGLRCMLIEGRLAEAGLEAARMVREVRPAAAPEDADQIHLLLR